MRKALALSAATAVCVAAARMVGPGGREVQGQIQRHLHHEESGQVIAGADEVSIAPGDCSPEEPTVRARAST